MLSRALTPRPRPFPFPPAPCASRTCSPGLGSPTPGSVCEGPVSTVGGTPSQSGLYPGWSTDLGPMSIDTLLWRGQCRVFSKGI